MNKLTVTLCGSFRRDPAKLEEIFIELQKHFSLLSPKSISFVNPEESFVRLADETTQSIEEIENKHLKAISNSDFVWLHAPAGYVGLSAATEVGYAKALGIPVYTDNALTDATLASFVTVVQTPESVLTALTSHPGAGLDGLQAYYHRICVRRDWDSETSTEILLLMVEEFGELARAIRKSLKLRRDHEYDTQQVEQELADVQLYLVHLANRLGVNLSTAVTNKENLNQLRFDKASEK